MDSSNCPLLEGLFRVRQRCYDIEHASFVFIASPSASSGIRVLANTATLARDDNEQSSISTRVHTIEGRLGALESTIDTLVQEIKRLSLKFDDRSLSDGAYRSGRERSSNNLPLPSPPQSSNPHPQPLPQHFPFQRPLTRQQPRQPSSPSRCLL